MKAVFLHLLSIMIFLACAFLVIVSVVVAERVRPKIDFGGRRRGDHKMSESLHQIVPIDTKLKFTLTSMAVEHRSDSGWHIPHYHDKNSPGWNRTVTLNSIGRPLACNIRFFATGLESTLKGFTSGGTGYLTVEFSIGQGKFYNGFTTNEADKLHCYYMSNKGFGSEFIDKPKTFSLAVYCPVSLDAEIGEYDFQATMKGENYCRSLADYETRVCLHLRPSSFKVPLDYRETKYSVSGEIESDVLISPAVARKLNITDLGEEDRNTVCPDGFVVPDNPSDPRVIWVKNTGCAAACRLPGYFTTDEKKIQDFIVVVAPSIGLPLISAVVVTWMTDKVRLKKQYLIFVFICLSAFLTTAFIASSISSNYQLRTCHDNATEKDQSDGISVCVVEAAIILFSCLGISFCWCIQATELFLKVVMKWKVKGRIVLHSIIILVLPAGAIIHAGLRNTLGYGRILPFCLIAYTASPDEFMPKDFQFFYFPVLISSVIGTACMVMVIGKIILLSIRRHLAMKDKGKITPATVQVAVLPATVVCLMATEVSIPVELTPRILPFLGRTESSFGSMFFPFLVPSGPVYENKKRCFELNLFKGLHKEFKLLRTSVYFLMFYLILWMSLWGYRTYSHLEIERNEKNMEDWISCVFQNFNGDNNAWKIACGKKPKFQLSVSGTAWFLCVISGHSILITAIFLPAVKQSIAQLFKNWKHQFKLFVRKSTGKKLSWYVRKMNRNENSNAEQKTNPRLSNFMPFNSTKISPDTISGPKFFPNRDVNKLSNSKMRNCLLAMSRDIKNHRNVSRRNDSDVNSDRSREIGSDDVRGAVSTGEKIDSLNSRVSGRSVSQSRMREISILNNTINNMGSSDNWNVSSNRSRAAIALQTAAVTNDNSDNFDAADTDELSSRRSSTRRTTSEKHGFPTISVKTSHSDPEKCLKREVIDEVQAALNCCDEESNEGKGQKTDDTNEVKNPDNLVENDDENTNGVSKLFRGGHDSGTSDNESEDNVSLLTQNQNSRHNDDKIENENGAIFKNENKVKIENEKEDENFSGKESKKVQMIPSPPPIPRNGKSPKIAMTEKNLKNDCSDVRKFLSNRRDNVQIISENFAGSFNDVETSASILNDIKPSKFGLLSKLLTGPETNHK